MKSTDETGIHSASARRKDNNETKESKGAVLLSDLPLEIRMEEASKPLYLSRYE